MNAEPSLDLVAPLRAAADELESLGIAAPAPAGKLLRPLVALALVPPPLRSRLDNRFWLGALALQMVHEASLLHDDILDGADHRRGEPTVSARSGVPAALVLGDHYLTGAYRAAARVGSPAFLDRFIVAVERTVAGETKQGRAVGRCLTRDTYKAIISGKSGELFGAAAVLGGALFALGEEDERVRLGRDLGALYQQVDDLLDYCPGAATGKPPLQDYRQRKWTWMMDLAGLHRFDISDREVVQAMFAPDAGGESAVRRAVHELERASEDLGRRVQALSPGDELIHQVLAEWIRTAERAVRAQAAAYPAAVAGWR
jgi:geranylgeranyl pyrophosphate synthase